MARSNRDEFTKKTVEDLAKRVAQRCSNPGCEIPTSGPKSDPNSHIIIGVAAHITAASPGGPRYDPTLTPEERRSAENGIWLCQTCARLIDVDEARYPVSLLHAWKTQAEEKVIQNIEQRKYLRENIKATENHVYINNTETHHHHHHHYHSKPEKAKPRRTKPATYTRAKLLADMENYLNTYVAQEIKSICDILRWFGPTAALILLIVILVLFVGMADASAFFVIFLVAFLVPLLAVALIAPRFWKHFYLSGYLTYLTPRERATIKTKLKNKRWGDKTVKKLMRYAIDLVFGFYEVAYGAIWLAEKITE